ncbi:GspH/FimT family pseudopilin [Nitrospira sp. Kam-Ns4a]
MNERGATFVELVVVMAILGLVLGALGESLVAAAGKHRGQAVATELAAELRAARFLALMRRDRILVTLDPASARLRTAPADHPDTVLREYEYGGGLAIEGASGRLTILFYPSGRAATATTLWLHRGDQERWKLTVSLTGRVSIE